MKKAIIALSVLISTQLSMAGATPITKIKHIYVYATSVVVELENTHVNSDGCSSSKSTSHLLLPTDSAAGNRQYSALLSAQIAGKQVRFGYRDCANWTATATLPKAYNITIF